MGFWETSIVQRRLNTQWLINQHPRSVHAAGLLSPLILEEAKNGETVRAINGQLIGINGEHKPSQSFNGSFIWHAWRKSTEQLTEENKRSLNKIQWLFN